jgi:ABC-2 type transport system ATP-binding protein
LDNRSAAEAGFPIAARLPFNNAAKPVSTPVLIPIPPPVADGSQAAAELGSSGSDPGTTQEGGERSEGAVPSATEDGSIATTPATSVIESTAAQREAETATAREQQTTAVASIGAVTSTNEAAAEEASGGPSLGEDQPAAAKASETTDAVPAGTPAAKSPDAKTSATKTPAAKTQAAATAARAPVRRAVKAARIRRAPTTVAAQAANQYAQTGYQWTEPAQTNQAARRVVVKRHRVVKKTAPSTQSSLTDGAALGPQ